MITIRISTSMRLILIPIDRENRSCYDAFVPPQPTEAIKNVQRPETPAWARPAAHTQHSYQRPGPGEGPQPLLIAPLRDGRSALQQLHQADRDQDQPDRRRRGSADRADPQRRRQKP